MSVNNVVNQKIFSHIKEKLKNTSKKKIEMIDLLFNMLPSSCMHEDNIESVSLDLNIIADMLTENKLDSGRFEKIGQDYILKLYLIDNKYDLDKQIEYNQYYRSTIS